MVRCLTHLGKSNRKAPWAAVLLFVMALFVEGVQPVLLLVNGLSFVPSYDAEAGNRRITGPTPFWLGWLAVKAAGHLATSWPGLAFGQLRTKPQSDEHGHGDKQGNNGDSHGNGYGLGRGHELDKQRGVIN